ncbi:tyrosine-type recombinase/integrase [Falsiroseomonas tokyonensis]|uniref:Tyrosine-type recombinase/integrase n=1 Tax=Falsiroseomonas tokyonensis TaxID=430521 RepID=A0ABV7C000_9PROT|nr:site-specific integrase [Falsiroseomonas tokyonensis]MBU8540235.1 site-specific integrase [Falsiroseomonas tokyonensis]
MPTVPRKPGGRRKAVAGEEFLVTRAESSAWHYDFSIEGERFRGSCGTGEFEAAAAIAKARFDEQFARIKLGQEPVRHLTLNDAFVRFYEEVAKGTTYGERGQKHQMNRMLRILGPRLRLADLTDSVVNDMVQVLRTTPLAATGKRATQVASGSTINRYIDTLSAVCRRAREVWGVVVGQWSRKKHRQAEPEGREVFLDHEVAKRVLHHAVAHIRPVMLLDVMTGMRKANAVGVTWEQISLPEARIAFIGKGGKSLAVPLPAEALRLLEALQPEPEKRRGPVFVYGNPAVACGCAACKRPDLRGKAFKDPKRSIKTAFRLAGLGPEVRFHDLRHTFASWLLAAGGDLKMVQERLGHADIKTTMRYAHIDKARTARVVAAASAGLFSEPKPTAEVVQLPAPEREEDAA